METALAANGFVRYTYNGKATIVLDKHHKTYEVDFETGEEFQVKVVGNEATIIHSGTPKLRFVANITDKKYTKLMRNSTAEEFVFVPHPKYPCYPFIPNLTFEMVEQVYAYFNDLYFNNKCPKRILFKKTTSSKMLGLAQYNSSVNGRPLYRMSVNVKSIGKDTILFCDTLLHEMVHLYWYNRGHDEGNNSYIKASHGPLFVQEMKRLNKLGFNISPILDWEERDVTDTELYALVATSPDHKDLFKCFWSTRNLEAEFESLVTQLRTGDPAYKLHIDLMVTSDLAVRGFPQISDKGVIPRSKLKLWYDLHPFKGRSIKSYVSETDPRPVVLKDVKVSKQDAPFYAQSFNLFSAWFKRQDRTATEAYMRTLWTRFPVKQVLPFAETELEEANDFLESGMNEADIIRKLNNVFARFDGRATPSEYRSAIRTIIEKHKLDALLRFRQLGL
jgi:SprT-like family.